MFAKLIVYLATAVSIAALAVKASADSAQDDYDRLCSTCHGTRFSLQSTTVPSVDRLAATIRDGDARRGMPAFGLQLSPERIDALAKLTAEHVAARAVLGRRVRAETLDPVRSSGFVLMRAQESGLPYIGYFGERSSLCYPDVDLTGVRSVELSYAKGSDEAGRFAILAGDGIAKAQFNLAEKNTVSTGGWETFQRHRVGLDRELSGRYELCFYGVAGGGILNLESFMLSEEPGEHDGLTLVFDEPAAPVLEAAGHRFVLERVGEAPAELWSMAFLPDGTLLVTQKNGQLLLFKSGKLLGPVEGVPQVWNGAQGGLMDVKLHPQYAQNGWIYLTFSDPGPDSSTAMTRVVRGKLNGRRWVEQQDIYRAPERFYTQHYAHFGSRLVLADGYVYFSIGERQQPQLAQSLAHPYGKIHRLHDDGRVPTDNPFVGHADALPSIWSYGHRNPQGMAIHPRTAEIWSAEHGPAGGDEINVIRKGANYGWPLVSFGRHYDGTPVGPSPYREGVEPPIYHFTPSIAISQIAFYEGDAFPHWRGRLLVASLGQEELRLLQLDGTTVVEDRLLLQGFGRIRDVSVGPDGHPYLLLNRYTSGVYRLRPEQEMGIGNRE